MKFKTTAVLFVAAFICGQNTRAQTAGKTVTLSFADFKPGTEKSWEEVADVSVGFPISGFAKKTAGTGVILNLGNIKESRLFSKNVYGDVDVEFDFVLDKGASLAVMLQERYRVNLSDSWQTQHPLITDMGGIGPSKQDAGAFGGIAPAMNVAKAPGLWQHARIKFRAPQFSGTNKTANALFEEVYINGVLVQQNAEVQSPSTGSTSAIEQVTGPLSITGGSGLSAIRNVKVTTLDPVSPPQTGRRMRRVANPILLNPEGKNYVLRSFVNFNGKKRTHVVSTGTTQQVNYTYDVKQGALLQAWHGPFMDVTEMWEQRGEPQLAVPLGNIIALSEAPALSQLISENSVWPDSVAFDDLKNLGYTLDKQRNPTFEYETNGYHVADKLAPGADGKSLLRELTVTTAPKNLFCRVTAAPKITNLGKGLYIIGDKDYYIQIDEKLKPIVRYSKSQQELLLPVEDKKTITYSLIW